MCFSSVAVKCISAANENDFPSRLPLCLADWLLGSAQTPVPRLDLMKASLYESLNKFSGLIFPPRTLKISLLSKF